MYIYVYVGICIYTCIYTVCMYACMYVCIARSLALSLSLPLCIYVYIYMYMYILRQLGRPQLGAVLLRQARGGTAGCGASEQRDVAGQRTLRELVLDPPRSCW